MGFVPITGVQNDCKLLELQAAILLILDALFNSYLLCYSIL